jgi:hypothetical protein
MNGQLMDNIQNAMKYTNVEMKMGGSRSYYQSAGSFQGFELLNNDMITTIPVVGSGSVIASDGQFGYVSNNVADIAASAGTQVMLSNTNGTGISFGSLTTAYLPLQFQIGNLTANGVLLANGTSLRSSQASAEDLPAFDLWGKSSRVSSADPEVPRRYSEHRL